MTKKKLGKKKLNKKAFLVAILTLYLIIMAFYYCLSRPISTILIKGNNMISDEEIISASKITNKDNIIRLNTSKVEKNIKSLGIVKDVNIQKKLNGSLVIIVKEQSVMFYDSYNDCYVLKNSSTVKDVSSALGIPTLINYVPSDIYKSLKKKISNINPEIMDLISEIEYSPDTKGDVVIDENRFLLRMNDGNYVYINLANFNNLNKYEEIYATLDDTKKGVLNLDSSSNQVLFQTFESLKPEETEESGK